ncbi:uncharacterized protein [Rutidosis leptorrhynchoides]|uniref:uncharacterized protein n=1 Tax=Rutidosis leptorrhynchoides TaxID=125765 RepID=UPI003A98E780
MEDFHKALKDDFRAKISLGHVKTFAELFDVAKGFEPDDPKVTDVTTSKRKFEASSAPSKKAKSGAKSVGSVKMGGSGSYVLNCYTCGQKGHMFRDCPNPSSKSKITCFNCQKEGHRKSECPDLTMGDKSCDNAKRLKKAAGHSKVQNFMMTTDDAKKSNEVVSGTFLVNSKPAKVLFDSGADMSYVSLKYAVTLDCSLCDLDSPLQVEIADGRFSVANGVYKNCVIDFRTEKFYIDLVPITLSEFDVVVGMGWLDHNRANLACYEEFVRVRTPSGGELIVYGGARRRPVPISTYARARRLVSSGSMAYLAHVVDTRDELPSINSIHVVNEFEDVFFDELPGVLPRRWLDLLKDYDLEILYHSGKANVVANALSRKNQIPILQVKSLRMILSNDFLKKLGDVQIEAFVNHKHEERIQGQTESIVLGMHGLLCFQGHVWVTKLGDHCTVLLDEAHNSKYSIHPGAMKMYRDLKK